MQTSLVNGISTIRGGKHVDNIINQIVKKLNEVVSKKKKKIDIKINIKKIIIYLKFL